MSFSKNYIVTDQLGAGAMATVHKAIQKSLERMVAVKQILPHLAKDEEFVMRFQREARAAANLRHENVVGIIDFGNEGENYYIVVEYIDGPSLRDIMNSGDKKLPMPVIVSVISQILYGLEHSHNNGIVHRDIKPANIMLTRAGIVKITDFGIAHATDLPSLTTTGNIMGTPSYMSPEQADGQKIDQRADLFSVGVILYEMLSGSLPFQGTTIYNLMKKIISEPHPPLKTLNPTVPEELSKIIDKALEKDVTKRFFDATEFVYALDDFASATGIKMGPRVMKEYLTTLIGAKEETKEKFSTSQMEMMKPTISTGKVRPTVAILPLQGCFGCHVNLLDLHDSFEVLANKLDIKFTYLMDLKKSPKVQLALVEGCVANTDNLERLQEMRANSEALVALGTCACFGGVPGLRNLFSTDEVIKRAYIESESTSRGGSMPSAEHVPMLTDYVKAVPDVVKTDFMIPGCPSPHDLILSSVEYILSGTSPRIRNRAVCSECKRGHKTLLSPKREFIAPNIYPMMEVADLDPDQCFLEQGVLCMGMVTREGCHARCTDSNFPCQGCMGPAPEVTETGAKWINTIGSLLPTGALKFRDDLVGFSYRYTLPISMMPMKNFKQEVKR